MSDKRSVTDEIAGTRVLLVLSLLSKIDFTLSSHRTDSLFEKKRNLVSTNNKVVLDRIRLNLLVLETNEFRIIIIKETFLICLYKKKHSVYRITHKDITFHIVLIDWL